MVVAALGPALTLVPLNALRLVVGALLLVFGLQWLRKAILRVERLQGAARRGRDLRARAARGRERRRATSAPGIDWYGFTLSFKGVFLEGLEVAFIVLTFGSTQGSIPLAAGRRGRGGRPRRGSSACSRAHRSRACRRTR